MARKFKTVNYEETLELKVSLHEVLPPNHLARFVVDIISQLDLSGIYGRYGAQGGEAIAPEILLGLLFYGYATGVFSSRKIEKATYESISFRFIAGNLHPDHDTIAHFRKTFLAELKELFVQILLLAQAVGVLKLGNLSLDGSKIHADASKSKAVSYKRLVELEAQLGQEVSELFSLGEQVDQGEVRLPEGLIIQDEIALRQERLANLAQAKAVLEARAQERYEAEKADYEAKLREREKKAHKNKRKPGGRPPQPPQPGPRPKDQYNFTDPDSPIMKNSTNSGFDQHYNVQAAVEQRSLLIVANTLSNHPNDKQEAVPTLDAVPAALGKPDAGAMDNGYFSTHNISEFEARGLNPISPPAVNRITAVGKIILRNKWPRPQPMLRPGRRWPTNCKLRSVKPSMACANALSNRSLGSSKKCWASASFPCAVYSRPRANGTRFALATT